MLNVLYEDNHLVAINKSSGDLVQGDRTGDRTLADELKSYIKTKYKKPGDVFLGVIHRLDRPVSGAVIFARTSKGLERMNKLFQNRSVKKVYWALTKNKPADTEGVLINWLKKDSKNNLVKAYNNDKKGGQRAELKYTLAGRFAEYYLIEVEPKTGRPHQIRVQLSKMGCPIIGDVKYGVDKVRDKGMIYLHSRKLIFEHPVKKEPVRISAGLPKDQVWELFKGVKL